MMAAAILAFNWFMGELIAGLTLCAIVSMEYDDWYLTFLHRLCFTAVLATSLEISQSLDLTSIESCPLETEQGRDGDDI